MVLLKQKPNPQKKEQKLPYSFCSREISKSQMKIHEKTCKENPNRVKKIHKKAKCQFCKKKWLLYISKITKTFVFKTQLKKKELKLTKMVFVKLYIKKN